MAQAARHVNGTQQLPLRRTWTRDTGVRREQRLEGGTPPCAWCREREARYGFRSDHSQGCHDRPSTLCFECFRIEMGRRQAIGERMARGWDAHQAALPLAETLRHLDRRRRRAQIAARHALDLG